MLSPLGQERQLGPLGGSESRQDVVGWVLPAGRASDAHPHPEEVTGAERGSDAPKTVMTIVAPAELDAQAAKRQIQFVVHDNEMRRIDSDAAAVQVTTLHGSKGLEYPVVLLPFNWHPVTA